MSADRINFILNNPTAAIKDDIVLIESEVEKYPYSQFLHILLAKIKNQLNTEDKGKKLTTAAVYSSDRTALKNVFQTAGYLETNEDIVPYQDLPSFELDSPIYQDSDKPGLEEGSDSSSIFDEVLKNLDKLKSLRKQFQFLELNDEPETAAVAAEKKNPKKDKESVKNQEKKKNKDKDKKAEANKKKLDEILEIDEVLDTQVNAYYLNEIEEKEKTVSIDAPEKHLVQNEIIEKFIEEQPSIGSLKKELGKSPDEINKDLSERSTRFGDDLVSENLAIILLRQGKKDRAIDIYKKLIWKLPQKKAYFAARIEDIKK